MAEVYTTASKKNYEPVRFLGAHRVINCQTEVKPTVSKRLRLEEIRFGQEQMESGRTQEKWVVQIKG